MMLVYPRITAFNVEVGGNEVADDEDKVPWYSIWFPNIPPSLCRYSPISSLQVNTN